MCCSEEIHFSNLDSELFVQIINKPGTLGEHRERNGSISQQRSWGHLQQESGQCLLWRTWKMHCTKYFCRAGKHCILWMTMALCHCLWPQPWLRLLLGRERRVSRQHLLPATACAANCTAWLELQRKHGAIVLFFFFKKGLLTDSLAVWMLLLGHVYNAQAHRAYVLWQGWTCCLPQCPRQLAKRPMPCSIWLHYTTASQSPNPRNLQCLPPRRYHTSEFMNFKKQIPPKLAKLESPWSLPFPLTIPWKTLIDTLLAHPSDCLPHHRDWPRHKGLNRAVVPGIQWVLAVSEAQS